MILCKIIQQPKTECLDLLNRKITEYMCIGSNQCDNLLCHCKRTAKRLLQKLHQRTSMCQLFLRVLIQIGRKLCEHFHLTILCQIDTDTSGCLLHRLCLRRTTDTYEMDFDALERCAADPRAKVMLLCNPHNPAGRVWTPDELTRLGNICLRNGVTVVADEIHCELVYQGFKYTPFASLSDAFLHRSVTCVSPSKAFNIAGLQIANIVAFDNDLRSRIDKAININEVCDVNPFGVAATIAAYNEGEEWLNQLVDYLHGNYEAMAEFCRRELPEYPITRLESTYLVWMDCSSLGMPSDALEHALLDNARLWLNAGTMYGAEGEGYMRWNIACPRGVMLDGLNRFLNFVRSR